MFNNALFYSLNKDFNNLNAQGHFINVDVFRNTQLHKIFMYMQIYKNVS